MMSTAPADALQHLSQQKGIYEVQRELKETGTLLNNVNQNGSQTQLEPMKCKASVKIRPHNFTLIQQHYDSCSCLTGRRMASWYSSSGILSSQGCIIVHALTISRPEQRGHRDEASVCTLHFKGIL